MLHIDKPRAENNGRSASSSEPIPDVSVVIVSWNVAKLLADCLDSLMRTSQGLTLEVWVVDNASSDNSVEMLRTRYPWVRLIANEDNRGFARANNQAIQQTRGRFVLILNPDTVVRDGAIQTLIQFLEEHADVGMVGPRLLDAEGNLGMMCARRFYSLSAALWVDALRFDALPSIGPRIFRRLMCPYDYCKVQDVEAISGAAMLVRRELLQDLDGFGDVFLHSGEDVDLCDRVRAAGWRICYTPEASIIHLGGRSTVQASVRPSMNAVLSVEVYFARCRSRWQALLYRCVAQCIMPLQLLTIGCLKRMTGKESSVDWRFRKSLAWHILTWRRCQ